ncbi:MAG: hypothetical protein H6624_04670 [Bdellovibrionaceae bacterium]|nr:hypothetical protein [Bdellovibrionales bacterium]MCB9083611.1 hypothetical protein [Pseudobdellovibrionaceae bacterium]
MAEKKIKKSHIDYGFGFPVVLLDAPFRKVQGKWVLDLNFEKYEKAVLMALTHKPARLSGNEVKFIRHSFEMTQKAFAKRFGDGTHPAVIGWEKQGDKPTNMSWSTEKDIRLFIVDNLNPSRLRKAYAELEQSVPKRSEKVQIQSSDIHAA